MLTLLLIFVLIISSTTLFAQTTNNLAPDAPGKDAQWEGAENYGLF